LLLNISLFYIKSTEISNQSDILRTSQDWHLPAGSSPLAPALLKVPDKLSPSPARGNYAINLGIIESAELSASTSCIQKAFSVDKGGPLSVGAKSMPFGTSFF
jgi:hypothetical protein